MTENSIVETLRSRISLRDMLNKQNIKLVKKGNAYFGKCPFCNDNDLFSVKEQIFNCYNCGQNGDIVTWTMKYESCNFNTAIKKLCNYIGISYSPAARTSNREIIRKINQDTSLYFEEQLKNASKERKYLLERNVKEETIQSFRLGYCNNKLYEYLKDKGYSDEQIMISGLFSQKDKEIYPKFVNRITFPIINSYNEIVGFGARAVKDCKPKYLNSPDSDAFDKSASLYGYHTAKDTKRNFIIICEGYMDVIAMHQAGFPEAVASLGTALTEAQVMLIKRITNNVFVCFDMDDAGKSAALKAIKLFRKNNMNVKVVNMQPYKDADEFLKNEGEKIFDKRLRNAIPPEVFEISYYAENEELFDFECVKYWVEYFAKKNIYPVCSAPIIREIESIQSKKDLLYFTKN